jgi:hypothetical protein
MNGRIGDLERSGMFLFWEIGADGLKRPYGLRPFFRLIPKLKQILL